MSDGVLVDDFEEGFLLLELHVLGLLVDDGLADEELVELLVLELLGH